MAEDKKIEALIHLLDDPDRSIFVQVSTELLSLGPMVIPQLEDAWESSFDPILQRRIEDLIQRIQYEHLEQDFNNWVDEGGKNLLKGAYLVCKLQYPELQYQEILEQVNLIKKEIWLELSFQLTELEQINVFNHVFYELQGFRGISPKKHSLQQFFINHVLETKKGNPISLGILYLALAEQLVLPVYGVNLPQHFVLSYCKHFLEDELREENYDPHNLRQEVMFYINPLHKGVIFTRNEIKVFLEKMNIEPKEAFYVPCNNLTVIRQLLTYLKQSFEMNGMKDKYEDAGRLLKIIGES